MVAAARMARRQAGIGAQIIATSSAWHHKRQTRQRTYRRSIAYVARIVKLQRARVRVAWQNINISAKYRMASSKAVSQTRARSIARNQRSVNQQYHIKAAWRRQQSSSASKRNRQAAA